MEMDCTPIMLKEKLKVLDTFRRALLIILSKSNKFILFTFFTSLPFFTFLVLLEIILQGLFLETTNFLLQPPHYSFYYSYYYSHYYLNIFVILIQLFLFYLIPYQLLEFLNILIVVPTASAIYSGEKPVSIRDMMSRKIKPRGPFITSIYVHLLSTTIPLGLVGFVANCCIMVKSFESYAYLDVLLTIVRGVGFTALLVKLLEWSAGWKMALVISILEDKRGIEALKLSAYINRNCSKRGLVLMLVFFVWGLIIRLFSYIFYGYGDELAIERVLFTSMYTLLIYLGNVVKWLVCVVYFFDCKNEILEKKVDDMEVGSDHVKAVDV